MILIKFLFFTFFVFGLGGLFPFPCAFASEPVSGSKDILSIFKLKKKDLKPGKSSLKRPSLLSRSIKGWIQKPTTAQSVWIDHLEREDYNSALVQWDGALGKLSQTETGRAFFAYLLYKTGFKVTGMEALFNIEKPQKIHPLALVLWDEYLSIDAPEWEALYVKWNPAWEGLISLGVEVHLRYLSLGDKLNVKSLRELFSKTREGHPRRSLIEWKLFSALALKGESKDAAKLLKTLMVQEGSSSIGKDAMLISVARVLFQNNYLTPALHYYAQVPKKSTYWLMAQEEMATSYLRLGQPQNALAVLMTPFHAYFTPLLGPEAYLLKALAELEVCHYTRLQKTLDQFKGYFLPKTLYLRELAKKPRQAVTLKLFQKMEQKNSSLSFAELGADTARLPLYITKDKNLRRHLHIRQTQLREQELAKKRKYLYPPSSPPPSTKKEKVVGRQLAESVSVGPIPPSWNRVKLAIELKAQKVDRILYARVQKLAREEIRNIHSTLRKLHIIEAELLEKVYRESSRIAKAKEQKQQLEGDKDKKRSVKKGSTVLVDKYKMSFVQVGREQWSDELSYYNVDIKGACNKSNKKDEKQK